MPLRVGIMGFGRIGRNVFRCAFNRPDIEFAAISDIADPEALAYLLKFDTVHGTFSEPVSLKGDKLYVAGKSIPMLRASAPGDVDWRALDVDFVVEATTKYRTRAELQRHLDAGAKRVILTVPPRDEIDAVVVMGVNHEMLTAKHRIVSNASCTANALAPIAKIINDSFGILRGFMTTVHAYTNDQRLADVPHSELRRSRAAAENIIPTTTWAPLAVQRILPELEGTLDGMAINVPVPDGSTVDFVTLLKRDVSRDEVNGAVREAAVGPMMNILEYCEEPIVSSDVIGNAHSAIFDSLATQVLGGNLVKTITWYDNGWGYANRVLELMMRLDQLDRVAAKG
jgi:glyceraldehyde 3-phosphate dehydrogenase